jgi:HEAT repeat protein
MSYRVFCTLLVVSCLLSAADSKKMWETLKEGAAENNPYKRAPAISALATIRTAEADKLVKAALTDKDFIVRLAAVGALADRK